MIYMDIVKKKKLEHLVKTGKIEGKSLKSIPGNKIVDSLSTLWGMNNQ